MSPADRGIIGVQYLLNLQGLFVHMRALYFPKLTITLLTASILMFFTACSDQAAPGFSGNSPGQDQDSNTIADGDAAANKTTGKDIYGGDEFTNSKTTGDQSGSVGSGGDGSATNKIDPDTIREFTTINNPNTLGDSTASQRTAPIPVEELKSECEKAKSQGSLKTATVRILFPGLSWTKADTCEWGQNGNNEKDYKPGYEYFKAEINGYKNTKEDLFNGRRRQFQLVQGPANSIICDTQFGFEGFRSETSGEIQFDDILFFTAKPIHNKQATGEEVILASSWNYNEYFQSRNNMYFYRWEDLKSKAWTDFREWSSSQNVPTDRNDYEKKERVEQNYCLGSKDPTICKMPLHGKQVSVGNFNFQPSPEATKILNSHLSSGSGIEFGLAITGDGEDTDCQHDKDIFFDVTISYTVPNP